MMPTHLLTDEDRAALAHDAAVFLDMSSLRLYDENHIWSMAQACADEDGCPRAICRQRGTGWYTVLDVPPDMMVPAPEAQGFDVIALVDPTETGA